MALPQPAASAGTLAASVHTASQLVSVLARDEH